MWGIRTAALHWKINANKLKVLALLRGVNPQPLGWDRVRTSPSAGWKMIQPQVLDMLVSRDRRSRKFPHCESRSCWGVSCINSVHVHRWCGCLLAGGSEKGAISTQMCLIASTLSWLAVDLQNGQMLDLALSLVLGVRWMQPVGTGSAEAGWASALVWGCFYSFAHLVDRFWCIVSAAGAVQ